MNDVMCSHINPKINDKSKEWMKHKYVKYGEVKANRGKVHKYIGMNFDFTKKLKVKINMDDYVERMIIDFTMKIIRNDLALTPTGNNIFKKGNRKRIGENELKSSIFK